MLLRVIVSRGVSYCFKYGMGFYLHNCDTGLYGDTAVSQILKNWNKKYFGSLADISQPHLVDES